MQQQQQQQQQQSQQTQQNQQKKPEPIYDLPIHNKPTLTIQQQQQIRQQQVCCLDVFLLFLFRYVVRAQAESRLMVRHSDFYLE